ncbi:DDE-type integrase/transposase/recombinase, partial [Brucella cytisi]|uniref:DDE-type integrase/transposase/recombinase n=1 Tax=Brucella cytisi TaxID=407152 RepID=UPI0035DD8E73
VRTLLKSLSANYRNGCPHITEKGVRELVKPAVPHVMVTDKLGSYGVANREIGLTVCDHRQHKGLNNRAENCHQPIRRRERGMKRFKSARYLQRFASIHDPIYDLHHFPRDRFTSAIHRVLRQTANTIWRDIARL